jgi:hypothetical protein
MFLIRRLQVAPPARESYSRSAEGYFVTFAEPTVQVDRKVSEWDLSQD